MPRLLLITPFFPPMSRVGAKRPLMLARHLPAAGWEVVVLTAPRGWDPEDPELERLVPPAVEVVREYCGRPPRARPTPPAAPAAASAPGFFSNPYLSPFDRFLSQVPRAVRAARALVAARGIDVISVCADPFTALFTGALTSRATGVPFVADLRDPWALQAAKQAMRPAPSRWMVHRSERWAFRRAAEIVVNTGEALEAYRQAYAGTLPPERFHEVRNAFDLGMFDPPVVSRPDRFTVLHFGQFRLLVPAAPLLEAFARFVKERHLSPDKARLAVTGTFRAEDRAHAERLGLEPYLEVQPDVPYRRSLGLLRSAHVLAFALDRRMEMTIPAKLYDYLAARRPIAALCDQPEPARMVTESGSGLVADPADPAAGAERLGRFYDRFLADGLPDLPSEAAAPYSAPVQAERFAAVLERARARRAGAISR